MFKNLYQLFLVYL